eukprot:4776082-Pyramimonas_sp.AAC.1
MEPKRRNGAAILPTPAQTRGANSILYTRGDDDGARVARVCRRNSGDSQDTGCRTRARSS